MLLNQTFFLSLVGVSQQTEEMLMLGGHRKMTTTSVELDLALRTAFTRESQETFVRMCVL